MESRLNMQVDAKRDKVAIHKLTKLRIESRQFSATSPVLTYPPVFGAFCGGDSI